MTYHVKRRRPAWGAPSPDETAPCQRCGRPKDTLELDRLLWCEECRLDARERAAMWGWGEGFVFAALVAAYILVVVRPTDLVTAGWVGTVVAAVWIGGRLGREVTYGVMRYVQTREPDEAAPGSPSGGDPD